MRWRALLVILLGAIIISTTQAVSASQEIVSSDYSYGRNGIMKLAGALYKDTGELDPSYDYYAIKVTTEDVKYRNDGWIGPMYIYVDIAVLPESAAEVPANHVPKSGIKFSQHSVSFEYEGIGFNVNIPRTFVSYWAKKDWAEHFVWEVSGIKPSFIGWWFVFDDYAEFAVGFRVPQNSYVVTVPYAYGEWYKFYGIFFRKVGSDEAVVGMWYSPGSSACSSGVGSLENQLIHDRNIKDLPETIKASPETQALADQEG
ncbi:hypothetical protein [Thermococcus sp.]